MKTKTSKVARSALVLAAGKGTRFKSEKAKVLHELCGKPLICHVLDHLLGAEVDQIFVVVGHDSDSVRQRLAHYPVSFILQEEQLGTGHAARIAVPQIQHLEGSIAIVYGDAPLMSEETLRRLFETRETEEADEAFVTCHFQEPYGYGRVIRDGEGRPVDIIEESDASPEERSIQEVNPGFYCFDVQSLVDVLANLSNATAQGEYYLTDTVSLLAKAGRKVLTVTTARPEETRGINDRLQLATIEGELRQEICRHWMREGVTLEDPARTYIDCDVKIGHDTLIQPGVQIQGRCRIGKNCTLGASSLIRNAELEDGVHLDLCSVVMESTLKAGCRIGPFAYIRDQSVVHSQAQIGSFVEIKKSTVGQRTKAAHLSYLGDAEVGTDVNIGAGTITCNFDGYRKNKTVIGDRAFIGSDTQLVAPVIVNADAWVAAGSCITKDVPAGALGIARTRQMNKEGWLSGRADKVVTPGEDN